MKLGKMKLSKKDKTHLLRAIAVGIILGFVLVGVTNVVLESTGSEGLFGVLAKGKRNSCNDTDGGIVPTVFGRTSGYFNRVAYNHSDYCVNNDTVKEYYCSGVYEYTTNINCGNDSYIGSNYCLNGSVYREFRDYYCSSGKCSNKVTPILIQRCQYGCANATCLAKPINLSQNSCNDTDGGIVPLVFGTVSGNMNGSTYFYTDYCYLGGNVTNMTFVLGEFYCNRTSPAGLTIDCATLNRTCSNGACR